MAAYLDSARIDTPKTFKISKAELEAIIREEAMALMGEGLLNERERTFAPLTKKEEKCVKSVKRTVTINATAYSSNDLYSKIIETIEELSMYIFEHTKIAGADSMNIYSIETAMLFKKINFFLNKKLFESPNKYIDHETYLIGKYDSLLNVFLPKRITRKVLFEKTGFQLSNVDEFYNEKENIIEIFNSDNPSIMHTLKIENR